MPQPTQIDDIRATAEAIRSAEAWTPYHDIAAAEWVELEACYFRAVDVVFDAIPKRFWLEA